MYNNNFTKKKLKVYLDTSIISYLDQTDAPEKMHETQKLWEEFRRGKYEVYISNVVAREIGACSPEKQTIFAKYLHQINYTVVESTEDTVELAEKFIDFGILRQKSFDDCQHIAAALLAECDIITSWNFKHIVNVKTIHGVRIITTAEGFKDLMICSPSSLIEKEETDD